MISTKIGIIGPKRVGKTTLTNLLNAYLKSLGVSADLVHETARNCPLPLNERTTLGTAYWLFGAQVAAESLVQETRQFTICDRTVIDLYPFALCAAIERGENLSEESTALQEMRFLKTLVKDYLQARPYEFLFYLPVRSQLLKTHPPSDDPHFQELLQLEFRRFLEELKEDLKIDVTELGSFDNDRRITDVVAHIQQKYDIPRSTRFSQIGL
jgi:hypothetical protein